MHSNEWGFTEVVVGWQPTHPGHMAFIQAGAGYRPARKTAGAPNDPSV